MSNQPCDGQTCPYSAIWRLEAPDAGQRPPQIAFACDKRDCLLAAVGKVIDGLMVSAGTINFQVSEDGFPIQAVSA